MGRWTLGTVQAKKAGISSALDAVALPEDEDGEVDEGAQAQLDAARAAIRTLVESGAFTGELHVTANGYAAKGGRRAAELPTSFVSIGISSVDAATGQPRTWVPGAEMTGEQAPAEAVVDAATSTASTSASGSSVTR